MPKPPPLTDSFLAALEGEILAGLPNEQQRRGECLEQLKYYRLRGAELVPRREAEDLRDYTSRIKRHLPLTRRVVRTLARLYDSPPQRSIEGDEAATRWLAEAYEQVEADVLVQDAERYAHLQGMAAIQVGATGDPAEPLRFHLWSGWSEVIPFEAPGRANQVAACITVDCRDETTWYTLWTDEAYWTFVTSKLTPGQTAGGRVARFVPEQSGLNPYGCLPFAFHWFETSTAGIDEQRGLGPFLCSLNRGIDVELSDMAQAVSAYHRPLPVAYDVDAEFNPLVKVGGFVRVNIDPVSEGENVPKPRLEYLQADLDIEAGWENIRAVILSELEALGVPPSAWTLDNRTAASGEAILAEQKPLTDYAKSRRPLALRFERDLARTALTAAGTYYARPDLLKAAEAAKKKFQLMWPSPRLDLPSQDRDREDRSSLELGLESRVMVAMRRFDLSRDQALAHLKQVAEDDREFAPREPEPQEPPPAKPDRAEGDEDDEDRWNVRDDEDDDA